jgi:hypothetical protein
VENGSALNNPEILSLEVSLRYYWHDVLAFIGGFDSHDRPWRFAVTISAQWRKAVNRDVVGVGGGQGGGGAKTH